MKIYNLDNFKRGWILGRFENSIYQSDINVAIHSYPSGSLHKAHYHNHTSEINVILDGNPKFNFYSRDGDLYWIKRCSPNEIIEIEPHESVEFSSPEGDSRLLVIKIPIINNDKVEL